MDKFSPTQTKAFGCSPRQRIGFSSRLGTGFIQPKAEDWIHSALGGGLGSAQDDEWNNFSLKDESLAAAQDERLDSA